MKEKKLYIASVENKKTGVRSVQTGEYFSKREMVLELRANQFSVLAVYTHHQYRELIGLTNKEIQHFQRINNSVISENELLDLKENEFVISVFEVMHGCFEITLADYSVVCVFVEYHFYSGIVRLKDGKEIEFNSVKAVSKSEALKEVLNNNFITRDISSINVYKELETIDIIEALKELSVGLQCRRSINTVMQKYGFFENDDSVEDIIEHGGMFFTHKDGNQYYVMLEEICTCFSDFDDCEFLAFVKDMHLL